MKQKNIKPVEMWGLIVFLLGAIIGILVFNYIADVYRCQKYIEFKQCLTISSPFIF